jgi:hydroxymethylbilane synthase
MLAEANPGLETQLVPIVTTGDRVRGPLAEAGGKGLFTRELEKALLDERVDLAVHSAKDLPGLLDASFQLASIPARADARDALICRDGIDAENLPAGVRIGTGSSRRAVLARRVLGDVSVVPIRGNVETRLGKLDADAEDRLDAVILAMAGLQRCGLIDENRRRIWPLPVERFVPAAGQGVLALEILSSRQDVRDRVESIEDEPTRLALEAERSVVTRLEADCHSCLGLHVRPSPSGGWEGFALAGNPDGSRHVQTEAFAQTADQVAQALYGQLGREGAHQWFSHGDSGSGLTV